MDKNAVVWAKSINRKGQGIHYQLFIKRKSPFRASTPARSVLTALKKQGKEVVEIRQEKGFWYYTTVEPIKLDLTDKKSNLPKEETE